MSVKAEVFKYFNLLEIKKRYGIKNKFMHYIITNRMLDEMPIVVKGNVCTENMLKYLLMRYNYKNKCEAISAVESKLLTNYVDVGGKKFDCIGFKIFCSLIRKIFVHELNLHDCSLDDSTFINIVVVDFCKLSTLNLSGNENITDYSIRTLEECFSMNGLKYLDLNNTGVSSKGIFKITQSPKFAQMVTLSIRIKKIVNEIDPRWFRTMKKILVINVRMSSCKKCNDEDLMEKFNDIDKIYERKRRSSSNEAVRCGKPISDIFCELCKKDDHSEEQCPLRSYFDKK